MLSSVSQTIDLHCHTLYSDGSLDVKALLEHFINYGVKQVAITDHDSIGAHKELRVKPMTGIDVIPGIEISSGFNGKEIHILGLNVNIDSAELCEFVDQQQRRRRVRLHDYAVKLESIGIEGMVESVKALTAEAVTRTHLSQLLVAKGAAQDSKRAFKRLIGHKGRAYIKMNWPDVEQVVKVILAAGGIPVLAHPGKYPFSRKQLLELIECFTAFGGKGIELSYPNVDGNLTNWMIEQTNRLQLFGSQGSDFHSPEWSWVKPGYFPVLPQSVKGVWSLWQ